MINEFVCKYIDKMDGFYFCFFLQRVFSHVNGYSEVIVKLPPVIATPMTKHFNLISVKCINWLTNR